MTVWDVMRTVDPTEELLRAHNDGDGDAIRSGAWYAAALNRRPVVEDDGAKARRLLAVLRFLTRLNDSDREEDLLSTAIQAAAVWYDVEAFAYRLDVAGRFVLDTHLPGADVSNRPRELPASITPPAAGVPKLLSSIVEIEELGWREPTGEIVLNSVVYAGCPRWVIVSGGRGSDEAVTAFAAVGQALGAVLQRAVDREVRELREQLNQLPGDMNTLDGTLSSARDLLAKSTMAEAVRLSVRSTETRTADPDDQSVAPGIDRVHRVVPLPSRRVLSVTVDSREGAPFRPATLAVIDALVPYLQQRVGAIVGASATSAFEARVNEAIAQARRSGRGLGLALVTMAETAAMPDPAPALVEVIRSGLRGGDLVGSLSTGEVAVVLVDTSSDGALIAGDRIRGRLQSLAGGEESPHVAIWRGTLAADDQSASVLFSETRTQQSVLPNTPQRIG